MEEDWVGKSVSIECVSSLGIFQGVIKNISEEQITIVRAFRNGIPLRKQDAEVTLRSTDILKINLIPSCNISSTISPTVINKPTPVKQPNFSNAALALSSITPFLQTSQLKTSKGVSSELSNQLATMNLVGNAPVASAIPLLSRPSSVQLKQNIVNGLSNKSPSSIAANNSVAQFFGNLIPPKVESRLGIIGICSSNSGSTDTNFKVGSCRSSGSSKPIDIVYSHKLNNYGPHNLSQSNGYGQGRKHNNSFSGGNGNSFNNTSGNSSNNSFHQKKYSRKAMRRDNNGNKQKQTFATSVDDPLLHEEFDFEGNLALFDKQAVWNRIESQEKPELVRQTIAMQQGNYRPNENILVSEPVPLRQIETMFDSVNDYVTDEGLIIPTIPIYARSKIEMMADKEGLSFQRQIDLLARGATDLTISLIGGARRLTPNNHHQWPKIVIICENTTTLRATNIGAAVGRQLASHGLKVVLYLLPDPRVEQNCEVVLFKSTGSTIAYAINALPKPDLVILSTTSSNLSGDAKQWLSENRSSILAIDPPPTGVHDVAIRYSILPILPLNGISTNACGKLYLCNISIPDKYYLDAGLKYKSPFGHKFVIPIHSKD